MENDTPNPTTNQLLIQPISEAVVLTESGFAITACNPAASALPLYNQQNIPEHPITFFVPTSSKANNQPSIVNSTFTERVIKHIDSTGKIIQLNTTPHAIATGLPTGGNLNNPEP